MGAESSHVLTPQGPRCSIRTQRQYSDASIDLSLVSLLYVPGIAIGSLLVYALDKALGLGA